MGKKRPAAFAQNFTLERISELLNGSHANAIREQIDVMLNTNKTNTELVQGLVDFCVRTKIADGDVEIQHLAKDWLEGWFPRQPVARLFLSAYSLALELATQGREKLPIESYWSVSADKKVRFAVAKSDAQVNVVLFTPPPAYDREVRLSDEMDPIWIVSARAGGMDVTQVPRMTLVAARQGGGRSRKAPASRRKRSRPR